MSPAAFNQQDVRRREHLRGELVREKATLRDVLEEVGHPYHEAVWMITLSIAQFKTELAWLARLAKQAPHRAAAKHPEVVSGV